MSTDQSREAICAPTEPWHKAYATTTYRGNTNQRSCCRMNQQFYEIQKNMSRFFRVPSRVHAPSTHRQHLPASCSSSALGSYRAVRGRYNRTQSTEDLHTTDQEARTQTHRSDAPTPIQRPHQDAEERSTDSPRSTMGICKGWPCLPRYRNFDARTHLIVRGGVSDKPTAVTFPLWLSSLLMRHWRLMHALATYARPSRHTRTPPLQPLTLHHGVSRGIVPRIVVQHYASHQASHCTTVHHTLHHSV